MNPRAPVKEALEPTSEVIRILEEYLEELEAGGRPDLEELAARHRVSAGPLRACLASLEFLQDAALSLRGAGQGGPPTGPGGLPDLGRLGDFRLVREVGRGGMGVVYEAEQISLGRRVALKVLPFAAALDVRQLQRFKNEAQAAACLHHTNIVPVYGVGCERDVHYYTMQFIEGQTLAALIEERRQQRETHGRTASPSATTQAEGSSPSAYFRRAAHLGAQAAEALEHAHQLGVVHRDIKPANLLVDARGNLWVTDFGLAHCQAQLGLTLTGDLVGTLRYMSPEQALGQPVGVDYRTDVYSLGATLYELLTLEPALPGRDRQEILRQLGFEEPRPVRRVNPAVPAELEAVVLKAMAREPSDRYATAQELADDLRRFLNDQPVRARRPSWVQRSRRWARRHRPVVWSAAAALLLTLVALAGIVGWAVRDHAERQARFADDVRAVLEKARWFQGQGKWAQARATAEQAEKLLAGGEVGEKLERRVHELNADLRMVASREEIGILGGWGKDGHSDEQKDRAYAAAFRDYGIDVETLDAGEAAGLIRRRTICVELAAALDDWAQKRRRLGRTGSKGWEGLLAVARAADPDPWRTKIRDAIAREDRRALKQLAASRSVCMVPPVEVVSLAGHLAEGGELDRATSLLRQAQAEHPEDFWINHTLGYYLGNRPAPRWDEAIPYFRVVVALRPDSPGARVNLGIALAGKGRLDDAGNSFRRAIQLKPDCAEAYHPFGLALHKQGRLNQAVAALRRLVELRRESAEAHHDLGNVLLDFGKFDQAADAYHRAIALEPEHARAHCNLGWALGEQGKFAQALAALERGHALGSRRPGWSWPSGRWVEECRRMAALAGRLPAVLRGEDRPADAAERDALALLCHEKKLYVAAARLRAEGLAAEPTLAEDLNAGHRFRAAGAATRAGSGEGADAGEADDKERARWREQALAWLRADLAAYRKLVEGGKPKDCQMVRRRLERWRGGQELASQFSRAPAIRPSESEQRAWIQLWADVQALMIKADAAEAAGQGEQ